ncbi:MAG: EpsI family protein [Desulfohalobiaceae bacterium]|nr:EpsI family protein [Desulfohalobiaceae bacterium]
MLQIPKLRATILAVLFLSFAGLINGFARDAVTPISITLDRIPGRIGSWRMAETQAMGADIVDLLGVDDYIFRNYKDDQGQAINVYVSYFSRTDRSKGYHSPLNCMPGSGWEIANTKPLPLKIPGSSEEPTVNRLLLQKGAEKKVSLYWYQCRGRILHNEYLERIYRVIDSIFKNRTDGAFIRLVAINTGQDIQKEEAMLKDFASRLLPMLREYLPG